MCAHSENCALMCTGGTKGESFFVHAEQHLLVYMELVFLEEEGGGSYSCT